jgi:hypothetical protein
MRISTTISELPLLRKLTRWWRGWRQRRTAISELGCCGRAEREHIARDLAVGAPELSTLAGRWPDSADLLNRRMQQVKLDAADIKQVSLTKHECRIA